MLCGFLDQNGKYTECASFDHINEAELIIEKEYKNFIVGLDAEEYLYEKGYVIFYSRGAAHRFFSLNTKGKEIPLSDPQIDFLIENLNNANNDEQHCDMMDILKLHEDLTEKSILATIEDKYVRRI